MVVLRPRIALGASEPRDETPYGEAQDRDTMNTRILWSVAVIIAVPVVTSAWMLARGNGEAKELVDVAPPPMAEIPDPQVIVRREVVIRDRTARDADPAEADELAAADDAAESPPVVDKAAELEALFQSAHPTSASKEKEVAVVAAFDSLVTGGGTLRTVECRGERCRMEISFENHDADIGVMRELLMGPQARIRSDFIVPIRTDQDDGSVDATVYLVPPTPDPGLDTAMASAL